MTVRIKTLLQKMFGGSRMARGVLGLLPVLLFTFFFAAAPVAPAHAQIFDDDGNSGSVWVQMFRGNIDSSKVHCDAPGKCGTIDKTSTNNFFGNYYGIAGWIADPGASSSWAGALRLALGLYSNALLIVASVILLYHLLIMVTETAHQGVIGGKRANQIWAPIRLVIAIGLLVPLSGSLNSAQYIMLQVVEWGSNMATKVWYVFLENAGQGSGSDPTPDMPDTSSIAREAAKIGACMALINNYIDKTGGDSKERIAMRSKGPAILYGNEKYESLCGSVIIFAGGPGAAAGMVGIDSIIQQMEEPAKHFIQGNKEYNQDPGQAPEMNIAAALGALESVSGGWNNAGGSSGAGWVSAGSWFLALAAGGSNRVSGTDTLPIIMGPQSEKIRPEKVQQAFYGMAEWIVGKYKKHASGGGADTDMIGNTVAGRKFVDLMMLFLDQMGVISGLWSPGAIAFDINLGNSPLAELVDLGHRMIRTALDFVGAAVELGVNEPQHAMYSSQYKASDGSKSFGPKGGIFFATMAIPILSAAAGTLITMGATFGIFMPLLPFTKFVLSVLTWVLSVLEALACVPLLALAWLTPYGEGFAGQKVESGYWLIIHAFLRPVMTIFGLVASMLLFNIAAYLVTEFYRAIAANVGTFSGAMYVVAKLAFGWMYVSILYLCLNASLKAMDTIGRNAVTWMGGRAHEENMGDGQSAVAMAQQGIGMVSQGLQGMAQSALGAGKEMAADMGGHGGGGGGGGGHRAIGGGGGNNPNKPASKQFGNSDYSDAGHHSGSGAQTKVAASTGGGSGGGQIASTAPSSTGGDRYSAAAFANAADSIGVGKGGGGGEVNNTRTADAGGGVSNDQMRTLSEKTGQLESRLNAMESNAPPGKGSDGKDGKTGGDGKDAPPGAPFGGNPTRSV